MSFFIFNQKIINNINDIKIPIGFNEAITPQIKAKITRPLPFSLNK